MSLHGHEHTENYSTVRSIKNKKAVGVQHWTGSVSTFTEINPSFRVFEVDEETMLPVKIHTYILNVSDPNPQWKWDHEMKEYYGMKDLSPRSFDELNDKLLKDEDVAIKFSNAMSN
jgi:sphingomyelin phosphodiesterase